MYWFSESGCSARICLRSSFISYIFINEITDNLTSLARLFADDTSLAYSGDNYDIIQNEINRDLNNLNEWSKSWLVDFNPKKTKALVISNTNNIPDMNIIFDNDRVEIVENHKHLGITLSNSGQWTTHIDNILSAALKQINVLRKLKFTLSKDALSNIYLSFIRPHLEYACEVWDGCFENEKEKLEKIQLEAARIVTGLTKFASKEALYFETGWEILADRRKNRKLIIFYKMHNHLCPSYLYDCLPPLVSNLSQYELRNQDNYNIPRTRLRVSTNSFIPSTASDWNNLDASVRNSPTIVSFKNRIRNMSVKSPGYYHEGIRKLSIIHARLRHQCSQLHADLYRINVIDNPKCRCNAPLEDVIHYLLECPLYLNERVRLFSSINENDQNIEVLLFGNDDYDDKTNSKIFENVRIYIKHSKRFD